MKPYVPQSPQLLGLHIPAKFTPYVNPQTVTNATLLHWIEQVRMDRVGAQNLLFIGARGTRKTTMAWTLLNVAAMANRTVELVFCPKLWEELNTGDDEKGKAAVARLATVDVLVLDDLTIVPPGPVPGTRLTSIIDERYGEKRPTVVTSNTEPRVLERCMGDNAHERFMDGVSVLEFHGESSREIGSIEQLNGNA